MASPPTRAPVARSDGATASWRLNSRYLGRDELAGIIASLNGRRRPRRGAFRIMTLAQTHQGAQPPGCCYALHRKATTEPAAWDDGGRGAIQACRTLAITQTSRYGGSASLLFASPARVGGGALYYALTNRIAGPLGVRISTTDGHRILPAASIHQQQSSSSALIALIHIALLALGTNEPGRTPGLAQEYRIAVGVGVAIWIQALNFGVDARGE